MENQNVEQKANSKKGSKAMLIILAVVLSPLAVPALIVVASALFAGSVTIFTLFTTGCALVLKSFIFLAAFEMVFFAKAFIGGSALVSMCIAPLALICVGVIHLVKKQKS